MNNEEKISRQIKNFTRFNFNLEYDHDILTLTLLKDGTKIVIDPDNILWGAEVVDLETTEDRENFINASHLTNAVFDVYKTLVSISNDRMLKYVKETANELGLEYGKVEGTIVLTERKLNQEFLITKTSVMFTNKKRIEYYGEWNLKETESFLEAHFPYHLIYCLEESRSILTRAAKIDR